MVATNVVNPGLLDQRPDMRLLQMINLVFIGRCKMRDHAAVMASDDHTTLSGGLDIIHTVLSVHSGLFTGVFENVSIFIAADAADVGDGVFRENVLGDQQRQCQEHMSVNFSINA